MELRTDEDRNIAYIRLTGSLDQQVILDAFDAAVADEKYRKGMGRLWDFREADLSSLEATTIAQMARHSTGFPPGINDVKVALVVGRNLEFGLSRMFEAYSADAGTTVAVFYGMEDAEDWLSREDSAAPG